MDPLVKIQKRAIRMISSASWDAHSDPLFKKLYLLNLKNIYVLNVMLFMYRFKKGSLPSLFDTMFVLNTEIHGHFTRQYNCYHSPVWRLEVRRRTISVQGPYFWNLIRKKIDCNCSISTFKFRIKSFLINNDVPYQVWKACGQYIYYLESFSCALIASISVCINV